MGCNLVLGFGSYDHDEVAGTGRVGRLTRVLLRICESSIIGADRKRKKNNTCALVHEMVRGWGHSLVFLPI